MWQKILQSVGGKGYKSIAFGSLFTTILGYGCVCDENLNVQSLGGTGNVGGGPYAINDDFYTGSIDTIYYGILDAYGVYIRRDGKYLISTYDNGVKELQIVEKKAGDVIAFSGYTTSKKIYIWVVARIE